MKFNCLRPKCLSNRSHRLKTSPIHRLGSFYRKSDCRKITRYRCNFCGRTFSSSTESERKYQKVRRINTPLLRLLNSGVSQRRAALLLNVDKKTIARRFRFLAAQARIQHQEFLRQQSSIPLNEVQFDDLETSEHTKCKPVSVALAVAPKTRKILSFQVNSMPAKGRLAKTALRKYGPREDRRDQGWRNLMKEIKPVISEACIITSDENPRYPRHVRKHFPNACHVKIPGGRGAITGQGELRKKKFDPMFALNHTCAMLRANLNRLFRKTWCTTKTLQGLIDHLSIYVVFHNQVLTGQSTILGVSS